MPGKEVNVSAAGTALLLFVLLNAAVLKFAFLNSPKWYWGLVVTMPMLLVSVYDYVKNRR